MEQQQVTRRALARGAAWSVPAVAIGSQIPAFAVSPFGCPDPSCFTWGSGTYTTSWAASGSTLVFITSAYQQYNVGPGCPGNPGGANGYTMYVHSATALITTAGVESELEATSVSSGGGVVTASGEYWPAAYPSFSVYIPWDWWASGGDNYIKKVCVTYELVWRDINLEVIPNSSCWQRVCFAFSNNTSTGTAVGEVTQSASPPPP